METIINFLEQHLFTCSIKNLFGFNCPGCGMQRAFIALLKGNLIESVKLNASLIPFLITIFFTLFHLIFSFRNGSKWIIILFASTSLTLIVNFVVKLILKY